MFLSYGTIFPSGSVALTSNVWQKNFQVNWSYQKFRHIWLQDSELKVGSIPILLIPETFCEVCNNAIIAKYWELERHN